MLAEATSSRRSVPGKIFDYEVLDFIGEGAGSLIYVVSHPQTRQLYALTRADSRIGFEPSCQYFYLPLDLVEKAINCRWLLGNLGK